MPRPSFWSRGEKDDPAARATPLLPEQSHLPGQGGERPLLGGPFRGVDAPGRLAAPGAGRRGLVGGPGVGVGVGVLLQQPGAQVAAQLQGTPLPLVEGDEVGLVVGVEHQVEGGSGVGQPAAPQLLVLDEPTAALDAQAEYEIYERFRDLTQGKTTLLISHRFSTVKMADLIVVLEHGRVIEQGSHADLTVAGGTYARLYEMQAQRYR